MTLRIRTKFLAFPAICILFAALLSLAGLDIVHSHTRLLERFSERDPAKTQRLSVLFNQLSRTHAAIYDLLSEAEQGLSEERIYEAGSPCSTPSGTRSGARRSCPRSMRSARTNGACTRS